MRGRDPGREAGGEPSPCTLRHVRLADDASGSVHNRGIEKPAWTRVPAATTRAGGRLWALESARLDGLRRTRRWCSASARRWLMRSETGCSVMSGCLASLQSLKSRVRASASTQVTEAERDWFA